MVWVLIVAAILVTSAGLIAFNLRRAARDGDAAIREALRESARAHQRQEAE